MQDTVICRTNAKLQCFFLVYSCVEDLLSVYLRKIAMDADAGCPVPIFSYFLSLFLFSPIFILKPPIFPIF